MFQKRLFNESLLVLPFLIIFYAQLSPFSVASLVSSHFKKDDSPVVILQVGGVKFMGTLQLVRIVSKEYLPYIYICIYTHTTQINNC